MEDKKSIYACYEEIKQREITELENAVRNEGGGVAFPEDYAPVIMCNFNGYYPHPADVRVTRVELADEEDEDVLHIYGQEKGESGCSTWYDDEKEINLTDIAYGHIDFITKSIPKKRKYEMSGDTMRLCEAVSELSNLLYGALYLKLQDSFAVNHEIIRLAIDFEESFDRNTDFLDEIDKYAKEYFKTIFD